MAKIHFRKICSGVVFILSIGLFPIEATASDFTLEPMLQEVVLGSEEQKEIEIVLTNTTSAVTTFYLKVIDFGSLDESGGIAFLGGSRTLESKYSLASWMKPEKQSVTLDPGASETLRLTVENTASLAPGGHYGAVVFQSGNDSPQSVTNTIAIQQMIASLVFVKKLGGADPLLNLREVKRDQNWFHIDREIEIRFHNPGNVHVVPRGTIKITDPIGKLRYRGVINEASSLVLPESERLYKISLDQLSRTILPGWYSFTLEYRFDGETGVKLWEDRFFLWPPLAWILLAFVLLLGAGIAHWYRRRKVPPTVAL